MVELKTWVSYIESGRAFIRIGVSCLAKKRELAAAAPVSTETAP